MGKPSRRRGTKKGRGGASAPAQGAGESPAESTPSSSATDVTLTDVSIRLRAKLDFHEATVGIDPCLAAHPDAPAGEFIQYTLHQWSRKRSVLNWFNAGCAKDETAELWVDLPSKDARKEFHRMIAKDFKDLKSLSRGLDGARRLLVVHHSNTSWDMASLPAEDEKKSRVLLATLREQNKTCSVDEAKEMVAQNTMSEETAQLLAKAMADQKALETLLDGIKEADVPAVRAALKAAPNLLSERTLHYETGDAPLHVACAGGSTTIIKILMEAGADIHQRDGKGRTALKVALAAEQCDAEGMLIQSGAIDPDADKDLQAELDLEDHHPSTDEEAADAPTAAAADTTAVTAASAAVPSTPPQEDAEPAGRPQEDAEAASAAASEAQAAPAEVDDEKVDTSSAAKAELADAIKPVAEAAHTAADSAGGAAPAANGAAAANGTTATNGASGAGPSGTTVTARAQAPVSISEIQPASPRPAAAEDAEDHRMIPDDGDNEEENGVEVLVDYLQDRTKAVVDWCKTHQGVVGTVALSAAAVGVAVLTALSKRR